MYLLVFFCVFVFLNNVFHISAENSDSPDIVTVAVSPKDEKAINAQFTKPILQVHFKVENLTQGPNGMTVGDVDKCGAKCETNSGMKITLDNCQVHKNGQHYHYMTASTQNIGPDIVLALRKCTFQVIKTDNTVNNKTDTFDQICRFRILRQTSFLADNWPYLATGSAVLVLLVIIGQTIGIIHFKNKARALRQENWSKRTESTEDTVRYCKMPVQKNVDICKEARESGIYEALENVRVPIGAPEPPPRNETATPTPSVAGTLPKKKGLQSLFGSLRRNKDNKQPKSPEDKRTSIERIKEREPMPIPTEEEVYEALDSPTPPRKELFGMKEDIRGFATQPRPKPQITKNAPAAMTLAPNAMSSQLKQAVQHRIRSNTANPTSPTRALPFNRGPPPSLATKGRAPHNPVPAIPGRAPPNSMPAISGRVPHNPVPATPGRAPPNPVPATLGRAPPNLMPSTPSRTPRSPKKPPPKSPVSTLPKWKPPPPTKPKQLHPLPTPPEPQPMQPPPVPHPLLPPPEPEPIPVETERGEYDSDDEWTYEPLEKYTLNDHIYNM